MSYNLRRYVEYEDRYGVTQRFELQELDYAGGSSEIISPVGGINFEHEELPTEESILKLYEKPVQKGSLELRVLVENSTDETLIQDIFEGDEDDFRIVWKQDGTVFWTGSVLNDLLEYPEENTAAKYSVSIYAKDFSRLEGIDFSNTTGRAIIITVIAELLDELGYDLEIETITSWISENTTSSTDFLQQHYIDRFALQTYARTGDESNENITCLEALEKICRNFCLILKQVGNVWLIEQYSAYSDPANAYLTVYNSDGTQKTATTQTDVTGNSSTTIKGTSRTKQYPGIKSGRVKYEHRTKVSGIEFPLNVEFENDDSESFSQPFISTGSSTLTFGFTCRAQFDQLYDDSVARYRIQSGTQYWNASSGAWQAGAITNTVEMSVAALSGEWVITNSTTTAPVPVAGSGTLTITIYNAISQTESLDAEETLYNFFAFQINNPVASENSEYIDYKLTQGGNYSTRYDHGVDWFGDGPTGYSRGAISTDSGGENLTVGEWQRRGTESGFRNFHENVLKEVIDVQRSGIKRTEANTEDGYNPRKVKSYRSSNYVYGGGSFNGDVWNPVLVQINIQTASDTFVDLPKFAPEGSTGESSTPSSGGVTLPEGDARWFRRSLLLGEIATADQNTAIGNLGITATKVELNILDGATLTTAELNYVDGVTSAIQTQLDGKQPLDSELTTLAGMTSAQATGLVGVSGTADFNAINTPSIANAAGNVFIESIEFNGATISGAAQNIVTIDDDLDVIGHFDGTTADFTGAVEVQSLDIGTTGHGFSSSGNVSAGNNNFLTGASPSLTFVENDSDDNAYTFIQNNKDFQLRENAVLNIFRVYSGNAENTLILRNSRLGSGLNNPVEQIHSSAFVRADSGYKVATTTVIDSNLDHFGRNADFSGTGEFGGDLRVETSVPARIIVNRTDTPEDNLTILAGTGTFVLRPDEDSTSDFGWNGTGWYFEKDLTAEANLIVDLTSTLTGDVELGADIATTSFQVVGGLIEGTDITQAGDIRTASIEANAAVFKSFTAEVSQLFRGERTLSKSFAEIAEDFVIPAVGNDEPLTIYDVDGFASYELFGNNDIVEIRPFGHGGDGLVIGSVFGRVTSYVDNGDGTQQWTFETLFVQNGALAGQTAYKGSEAKSYGSAASPVGVIQDSVFANVPYTQVYTWATNPWTVGNRTIQYHHGDLDELGITGVSGVGVYTAKAYLTESVLIGDLSETDNYLKYDGATFTVDTEAFRLKASSDFWRTSDNSFQFGGASGITYAGSGDVQIGSSVDIAGDVTFSGSLQNTTDTLYIDDAIIALTSAVAASTLTVADSSAGFAVNNDGEMKSFIDAKNFIRNSTANGLQFRSEDVILNNSELYLSSQPNAAAPAAQRSRFALGTSAGSQALQGNNNVGVFMNGAGQFRAGEIDGSGNLSAGVLWDGTDVDANTETTRFTSKNVTYKDAVIDSTSYSATNVDLDGTGAQALQSLSVSNGRCVRYWFDYSISYSGSGSYEIEIDVQGWNGSSWVTLDENEFGADTTFPLVYLYRGGIDANSSTQNVNGLTYTLSSNTSQSSFSGTWYFYMYALDAYSQYRLRVLLSSGGGGGGSKLITANQIRAYERTAVFSQNGTFYRDADIIKGKANALGIQTEIDTSSLVKGTT